VPPLYTRRFWLLYASHFTAASSIISFVLLPLRIEELGGGEVDIGWIAAAGIGGAVAIRWLTGHLSDRIGRRQVMLVAAAVNVVACLSFIGVGSLWPGLGMVRVMHGMAGGALFGGFFTIAADICPAARRAEGLAVFGTSGMAANWFGPYLGELAIGAGGFAAFFATAGGLGLLALVLVACVQETGGRVERVEFGRVLLRSPPLMLAFALTLLFGFAAGSYFTFLAHHLDRISGVRTSDFFLAYTIAALTLRIAGRRLPDRLGARRLLPPSFAVLIAGVAMVGVAGEIWTLRLAGVLCGLGHGYVFPLLNALVVRRSPPGSRGVAVNLFTALIDLGVLVGGPVLGAVAARLGYGSMYLATAAGVALVALLLGVAELRRGGRTPAI